MVSYRLAKRSIISSCVFLSTTILLPNPNKAALNNIVFRTVLNCSHFNFPLPPLTYLSESRHLPS
ncbi:MAG: hypothetical protein LBC74_05405 [Planctomycetaceae bacterium]|nr:hypothetical protein [Planctomycetaceae bacterium]